MKTNTLTPELPQKKSGASNENELTTKTNVLTPELVRKINAYWRAANWSNFYVAAAGRPTLSKATTRKQTMQDKLIEHKHYIDKHGEDLPEIRNWK